ncbi:ABC transporter permease [Isobaculum melis]|uniref:Iron complex transport system permease protein n=1 Tax=Isobaculum melis TaxID=142588 RepID=A0A1H9RQR9_9LACT|nr:ABC transporter permease [Isobaculum melis]SER75160.1 iron complex transport system permease protein [Isobaculum melis]
MRKGIAIVCLIILSFFSLFVGVSQLNLGDLFHLTDLQRLVLFTTRIPRMVSLLIAGSTMSICGLLMQNLTQNKFVSPTTGGTMDSARVGILVAMIFFHDATPIQKIVVAFAFALFGTFLFLTLLDRLRVKNKILVPLIGMMFGSVIGAIATFLAYQFDLVQNVTSWLQGNFALVTSGSYELLYISIPLMLLAYFYAHHFTIVGMGHDFATGMGIRYQWVRGIGLSIVAISSAVVILTVGSIPFIGLIIPNLVTIFLGDHLKNSLFATALSGAAFLIICDIISRVIVAPYEVSVSLIVGVIGSIVFLYLLFRGGKTSV